MLFAGKFVDRLDTKKGYLWAIGVWSAGAVMHAFCGLLTSGIVAGEWTMSFEGAKSNSNCWRCFFGGICKCNTIHFCTFSAGNW